MTTPPLAPLVLRKGEDRRLRTGHSWIFSNEIDTARTPLTSFAPGQPVLILDQSSRPLGTGYVNPHSLIAARLVSRDPDYVLGKSLLTHRIQVAESLRQRVFAEPYYRLVFGDSDGLPGLVLDQFGDIVVAQITTAGMEQLKADIVAAVAKVIKPSCVIFRNDGSSRSFEGLELYTETALGTAPERLNVKENGAQFQVPAITGQKTGWFYDHRLNRQRMASYVAGKRVLDVFSYAGAWGIQAARAGAEEVWCVDSSDSALEGVRINAEINGVQGRIRPVAGDAFEVLKQLRQERARFDVVILDPPAFIRRKKDLDAGTDAYRRLNQAAMQVLDKDGLLISASCSSYLSRDTLRNVLLASSRHVDRFLQVLEQGHQGPDHPVHPAIPETDYLKAFICRVLPT